MSELTGLPPLLTPQDAAELLRTSRKAIYVMAERGQLPGITRVGRRLLFRREKSEFSKRDAFEGTKARFTKVADMDPALGLLRQHGFIREKSNQRPKGKGRPPGPVYEVNPISQKSHNSQKSSEPSDSANFAKQREVDSSDGRSHRDADEDVPRDPSAGTNTEAR